MMAYRSWLFVPGDSEKKLARAADSGADVVVLDLEDSVVPASKPAARVLVRDWLAEHRASERAGAPQCWVRINPLDGHDWRDDIDTVIAGGPAGIMLPKADGPAQIQQLAAELYEAEARNGIGTNTTRILPLVSETAHAALTIPAYLDAPSTRLIGLTWGAEDLSAALGATRKRTAEDDWTDTFRFARTQTLLTAHARGIMAIDTLHADFRDESGLARVAAGSRADGFAGMLAIHPAQVPIINAAFTPSDEELAEARAIVAAFSENPTAGALQIDGRMIDRPHLKLAERLLASTG